MPTIERVDRSGLDPSLIYWDMWPVQDPAGQPARIAGRDRGWVHARYLSHRFEGTVVTIRSGGAKLGVPTTEFQLGPYWDAHFQNQTWYGRKAYWQRRWDQRPPPRSEN